MNSEIKKAIKEKGLRQWMVAQQLGIGETTLVRWLRNELFEERKNAILSAIEALSRKGA